MAIVVWFPMTWAAIMVMTSHWVGLTFPGMIEEPGSFSGRNSSPNPQRGPEPKNIKSLAIFIRLEARVDKDPWNSTKASCAAKASNLFGAVLNSTPVSLVISSAKLSANPSNVFNPVPTAVPPYANSLISGIFALIRAIPCLICQAYPLNS